MRWKSILDINTWQDILREMLWKARSSSSDAFTPSWSLDKDFLSNSHIQWPSKYEWPTAHKWVTHLKNGFECFLPVHITDIPQPRKGMVQIELIHKDSRYDICIDYSDYNSFDINVAEKSLVYFKMQYRKQGYPEVNVVPGGFVPNDVSLYKYLPHLRSKNKHRPLYDVSGRFSLDFAKNIRTKAIDILKNQTEFEFVGGLKPMRYSRFLLEASRSAICINLPGNGDFCFRLVDYLSIGSCIISTRHINRLHVPLEDRKHIVFVKNDLSNLVDLCKYYLEHDGDREALCHNSKDFFDRYLHYSQLSAYYLNYCFLTIEQSSLRD